MGSPAGEDRRKSEATKRQEALSKELGIDTYARYPRELIEFMMDLPPRDEIERQDWKPIHSLHDRVYFTIMRYSWSWPICMSYAVVTDERDEIKRNPRPPRQPLLLSEKAIAEMHEVSPKRISSVVLDLADAKMLRRETRKQGGVAELSLEAKPAISTEERRRVNSTIHLTGIDGPRLEPYVTRLLSNLINQLGDPEGFIDVPGDDAVGRPFQRVRVRDLSTSMWKEALATRTTFLSAFRDLKYSERKAYSEISTRVRYLISQSQSSDIRISPSPSGATEPVTEAPGTSETMPAAPASPLTRHSKPANAAAKKPSVERGKPAASYTPGAHPVFDCMSEVAVVAMSSVEVLVNECRRRLPDATLDEIAWGVRQRQKEAATKGRFPIAYLLHTVPDLFPHAMLRERGATVGERAKVKVPEPAEPPCPRCHNSGFVGVASCDNGPEAERLLAAGQPLCSCAWADIWRPDARGARA